MLTSKQEAFCQALATGGNQSDSYRQAYAVREGTSTATIAASASRLMTNPKIAARIAEIRNIIAEAIAWTRNDSAKALIGIVQATNSSPSAMIAAIRELNSMYGFGAPEKHLTFIRKLEPLGDEDFL